MSILPFPRRRAVPREFISRYTVNGCPPGVARAVAHRYDIDLVLVDDGSGPDGGPAWLVRVPHLSSCLTADGALEYEPIDPFKTDAWRSQHLFDLDAARFLAVQAAPDLLVDGVTARDAR